MPLEKETGVLIEACGVDLAFSGAAVLSGVSAKVEAGKIVTLIGPNGAGKTTLVRVMLGLLRPDRGTVRRRPGLRIGYVPQRLSLDGSMPMSVSRFLELAVRRAGKGERRARVLDEVGVGRLMDTPLSEVSGGEFQRVLLARALLRDPDLLVLDEPVQGVDVTGQGELYDLIGRVRDERGLGVLMVSHDLHLVMAAADRVVCLNRHVCCAGHPEAVSRDPAYRALFGEKGAGALAFYHHHHDHFHHADGTVAEDSDTEEGAGHG